MLDLKGIWNTHIRLFSSVQPNLRAYIQLTPSETHGDLDQIGATRPLGVSRPKGVLKNGESPLPRGT